MYQGYLLTLVHWYIGTFPTLNIEHSWRSQAAKPSETLNIMEQIIQLNANAKLSEHFSLGEMTRSNSHPEIYNIPSHEAITNLTNLCKWLEVLRERASPEPTASPAPSKRRGAPIIINSGYRSPQLNRKIGGAPNSNHLTGCAADIRVENMEQLIRYAAILLDYADESKQEFDELLIERRSALPLGSSKNSHGAIWLHFAVRPRDNRHKVAFINA